MTHEICKATKADLAAVEQWLLKERQGGGEGFYVNWSVIEDLFYDNGMFVLVVDSDPLAFIAKNIGRTGILEVRPDQRGKGYGRLLAQWWEVRAFERGLSVIEIECAPATSIAFWQTVGFTAVPDRRGNGGGVYGFKILPRNFDLPAGAQQMAFDVSFYPEEREWHADTKPFGAYLGSGAVLDDGFLHLPQRAICFEPHTEHYADCVMRVSVDDAMVFEGKVKRAEARSIGVERDPGGFYFVDRLRLP